MGGPSRSCGLPWQPLNVWLCALGAVSIAEQARVLSVSESTISRWRTGRHRVSTWTADERLVSIGILPIEVWGEEWLRHVPSPDARSDARSAA